MNWLRERDRHIANAALTVSKYMPGWYSNKEITDRANDLREDYDDLNPKTVSRILRNWNIPSKRRRSGAFFLLSRDTIRRLHEKAAEA